jgi:cytochrome c6
VKTNFRRSGQRGLQKVVRLGSAGLLLVVVSSWLQAQESTPGAGIFKSKCVICHGADGTGNTPLGKQLQAANLGSKDVQKMSNAELHKVVHDGRANMPPFADQLSDEQIGQVIQYVRHFAKKGK